MQRSMRQRGYGRSPITEALESRLLFSSSVVNATDHPTAPAHGGFTRADVVIIDDSLQNAATLISATSGATTVIVHAGEGADDVLARAAAAAANVEGGVRSVQVFSHGAAGSFALGDDLVDDETLDDTADGWASLAEYASDDVDFEIDLYGCDVADTDAGTALLEHLAGYTGATVRASTDPTGRGGDWDLEAASDGSHEPVDARIRAAAAFSAYAGTLGLLDINIPAAGVQNPTTGVVSLSVLGASVLGESAIAYTWSATSKPVGASNPVFAANGTNASKNTTATFDKPGVYTLKATLFDGALTLVSTVNVTVAAIGSAIGLTQNVSLNYNQTYQFAATALDQFGQPLVSQPTFTWQVLSGGGTIDASGLYTAPASGGTATVKAVAGGLFSLATVTVSNAIPTLAAAAAAVVSPTTGTTAAMTALGADDGGESGLTYTWSTVSKPTGASNASFSANGTNAAKAATATFDKAGLYTLACTISDGLLNVVSTVNVTVSQILKTITLTPSTKTLPLNGTQALSATALDQFGAALTSQPAFAWSVSTGSGVVNAAGTYTAPASATVATVAATAGGIIGNATMTVANTIPTIATGAASLPGTVTGTTAALSALGADDGGESALTYAWSVVSKPIGAADPTFSATGTNAAKNATATFSRAGTYTLACTISDGLLSVVSNVAVTVSQTLTSIGVSPGITTLNERQTVALTALAFDQFTQVLSVQPPITWSIDSGGIGSVSTGGLFTAPAAAGLATVRATAAAISGAAVVAVSNALPTLATPAAAAEAIVSGTATTLSVLGDDDGGESALRYTWSIVSQPTDADAVFAAGNATNAAKNLLVTFNRAGNYVFRVVIDDGQGGSLPQDLAVTVGQTLSSIGITPQSPSVATGGQLPFVATPMDQFAGAMQTPTPVTWSMTSQNGSSIDANGVFTAGAQAAYATVTAVSGAVQSTTGVFIGNIAPVVLPPVALPPVVATTTAQLSVTALDDGGESNLTYTWSIVSAPAGASAPSFTANGTNAAKNAVATFSRAGAYKLMVAVNDGSLTSTATLDVVVVQTLTAINVSAASQTLTPGTTTLCVAAAVDQFGLPMAVQPTFNWVVSSGGGVVSSLGLFGAPTSVGQSTVSAIVGAVMGYTNLNIATPSPTLPTIIGTTVDTVDAKSFELGVKASNPLGSDTLMTYVWTLRQGPAGAPAPDISAADAAGESRINFRAAGNYFFDVSVTNASGTTTTTQLVTVNSEPQQISIASTDGDAPLASGGSRRFTSSVLDQFDQPYSGAVTWSIDAGGFGLISSDGLYSAPYAGGGPTIVRATLGDRSVSTLVTVLGRKGKPVKPQAFAATRLDATTVRIQANFSATPGTASATGLKLERKAADGSWETLGVLPRSTGSFDVANVPAGTKQSFRFTPMSGTVALAKPGKLFRR